MVARTVRRQFLCRHVGSYLRMPGVALAGVFAAIAFTPTPAGAVGIQGTMSNFDVFNETGSAVYEAELDLEGVHANQVTKTYPNHFNTMTPTEYSTAGGGYGTKLLFANFNNFGGNPFIPTTTGFNTNGHYAVNQTGCEHFGFSVITQPSATQFYWLNSSGARLNTTPLSVPNINWTYVPAAGAVPPAVKAAVPIVVPPPAVLYPDTLWVKVYFTEIPRVVDVVELLSGDNSVAPQLPSEVEAEWMLWEPDVGLELEQPVAEGDISVLRRFEFFKYTGSYDPANHLPQSSFQGLPGELPPAGELGGFLSANMVAAVLDIPPVPEPATLAILAGGLSPLLCRRPFRRKC